jgi:spore germination cell wall hydrolase CwlJ-like protein
MRSRKTAAAFLFVLTLLTTSIFSGTTAKASTPQPTIAALEKIVPSSLDDIDGENRNQIVCLALNMYHEARGSTQADIMAVGHTTKNRTKYRKKTYCNVIWEKGQYDWVRRPISQQMPKDLKTWRQMVDSARQIVMDDLPDPTKGADSFYSRRRGPTAQATRSSVRVPIGGNVYYRMGG